MAVVHTIVAVTEGAMAVVRDVVVPGGWIAAFLSLGAIGGPHDLLAMVDDGEALWRRTRDAFLLGYQCPEAYDAWWEVRRSK
jgi:hypothetical protein